MVNFDIIFITKIGGTMKKHMKVGFFIGRVLLAETSYFFLALEKVNSQHSLISLYTPVFWTYLQHQLAWSLY